MLKRIKDTYVRIEQQNNYNTISLSLWDTEIKFV